MAVAACMAALSPLWLAHSTLVTMDAALTLFALASAYFTWRSLRSHGSTRQVMLAAVTFTAALGMASKYSMVAWLGALGLAIILDARFLGSGQGRWIPVLFSLVCGVVLGVLFAWGIPPHPDWYLAGIADVGHNHDPNYAPYAFGELHRGAYYHYFLVALATKVSIPVLATACCVGLCGIQSWIPTRGEIKNVGTARATGFVLWLPPVLFLLLMSLKAPGIGVRYVLPVLPYAFILAGCAGAALVNRRGGRVFLGVALLAQMTGTVEAMQTSPLAWFNGLPCRTGQILPCLDDSNLDWGQGLPALETYRKRHYPELKLRVYCNSWAPIEAYMNGVRAGQWEKLHPHRAVYAVSLHSIARSPEESWMRVAVPDAVVAGAYAIFDRRSHEVRFTPDAPH
jgi:4-amino-4-deoxy-L-arabinose transferase-like glycosyltransferase